MNSSIKTGRLTMRPVHQLQTGGMTPKLPQVARARQTLSHRVALPPLWVVGAKGGGQRQRKRKVPVKKGGSAKDSEFAEAHSPAGVTSTQDLAKQFMSERNQPPLPNDDDKAFNAKLAALKAAPASPTTTPALNLAPFQIDGYLSDTPAPDKSTDDEEGNDRLWLQIVVVLIVGVFVFLYSGSDLQTNFKRVKRTPTPTELAPLAKEELLREADKFEAVLSANPEDVDAVEGAAVSYAKLGEYKKADEKLEKLITMKPRDVEVIRLLAETKAEEGDYKASAEKYKQALQLSPDNLELLRNYITILSRDGRQAQAIEVLQEIRPRAQARGNVGIEGFVTDPVDIVQLELLAGKTYSEWKGHSADAIATYNSLIQNYKDDFRGYLGKGSLLKEVGKAKDAERMFLQARYLAPDVARPLVEQVANRPGPKE